MRTFVIGYGSLMEAHSRSLSCNAEVAYPVIVHNFKRGWNQVTFDYLWLGCQRSEGAKMNGVIFQVDASDMVKLERREIGYQKTRVEHDEVEFFFEEHVALRIIGPGAEIFTFTNPPVSGGRLYNSYIDTCAKGCLQVANEQFLKQFIELTDEWSRVCNK